LLIHCEAGADRTGLASVIYELQYEGKTLNESLKQLSFFSYGHFGLTAIDDFFRLYEKFGENRDLRKWVQEDYDEKKYKDYFEAN
jgi:protein tyrosine/serine phosphatase